MFFTSFGLLRKNKVHHSIFSLFGEALRFSRSSSRLRVFNSVYNFFEFYSLDNRKFIIESKFGNGFSDMARLKKIFILHWRFAVVLFKSSEKICIVIKAACKAYFGNTHIRKSKELFGIFITQVVQMLFKADARLL